MSWAMPMWLSTHRSYLLTMFTWIGWNIPSLWANSYELIMDLPFSSNPTITTTPYKSSPPFTASALSLSIRREDIVVRVHLLYCLRYRSSVGTIVCCPLWGSKHFSWFLMFTACDTFHWNSEKEDREGTYIFRSLWPHPSVSVMVDLSIWVSSWYNISYYLVLVLDYST